MDNRTLVGLLAATPPADPSLTSEPTPTSPTATTCWPPAKLFSPYTNWTWYITELDPETGQCFGLVEGFERELGYFDLSELAEATVFGGVPAVERDLYWQPRTIGEIRSGSPGDSQHSEATRKGETMNDETGTETSPSDAVSVEECLSGKPADDATAEVDGDAASEQDANEEAEPDPPGSDDAGENAASPEELKVVLSIRGGRATIGVQQPSSDPHIESFDDPDLFGLADEFPAVVARARARVGGGTQVSRLRKARSPSPSPASARAGGGYPNRRGRGGTAAARDAAAVLAARFCQAMAGWG